MQHPDDQAYYRARARTERALAEKATDSAVRMVHRELARRYEALARETAPMHMPPAAMYTTH